MHSQHWLLLPAGRQPAITLSFGLVNIPLSVYTGTEETRVARKEFFQGTNVEVGRSPIRKDTGEIINDDVVRMAQADSGAWVALTDDEIAACTSPRGLAEIVSFVKAKVAQYLIEDVKQVRPKREKGKANPAAEHAFACSRRCCRSARCRPWSRSPCVDRPATPCWTTRATCSWSTRPMPCVAPSTSSTASTHEAELNVANMLIDAVGIDAPVLLDTTAPVVKAYVNDKAKGIAPAPVAAAPAIPVDVMSQLLASIDAANAAKAKAAS